MSKNWRCGVGRVSEDADADLDIDRQLLTSTSNRDWCWLPRPAASAVAMETDDVTWNAGGVVEVGDNRCVSLSRDSRCMPVRFLAEQHRSVEQTATHWWRHVNIANTTKSRSTGRWGHVTRVSVIVSLAVFVCLCRVWAEAWNAVV